MEFACILAFGEEHAASRWAIVCELPASGQALPQACALAPRARREEVRARREKKDVKHSLRCCSPTAFTLGVPICFGAGGCKDFAPSGNRLPAAVAGDGCWLLVKLPLFTEASAVQQNFRYSTKLPKRIQQTFSYSTKLPSFNKASAIQQGCREGSSKYPYAVDYAALVYTVSREFVSHSGLFMMRTSAGCLPTCMIS